MVNDIVKRPPPILNSQLTKILFTEHFGNNSFMEAKEERPHPICEEHRQPIKLICTDVQCTSNPLVCSVCLCEKKDYHKRPQGMIHQLRELLPLVEKAFLIERSSEERFKKTDKLAHNYFDALRTKLKTLVDVSE